MLYWHTHRKRRAFPNFAFHADRPAQELREFLCNRQPQPGALLHAALAAFGLTVFVEDGREFVGGYAFAGVRYRYDENREPGTGVRVIWRSTGQVFLLPPAFYLLPLSSGVWLRIHCTLACFPTHSSCRRLRKQDGCRRSWTAEYSNLGAP